MLKWITGWFLGKKVANSETRHRPAWFPSSDLDIRPFGGELALMCIPPYKPPYRRHRRLKLWACTPGILGNRRCVSAVVELDLDERTLDVDLYR
jgi:hypothetical protein